MIKLWLQLLLQKLKEFSLARPTTIKLEQGEVILKNVPKERIDQIKKLLNTDEGVLSLLPGELVLGEPETTEEGTSWPVGVDISHLTQTGIGYFKDSSGSYKLVELKFNADTQDAIVTKVTELGKVRLIADSEMRKWIGMNWL